MESLIFMYICGEQSEILPDFTLPKGVETIVSPKPKCLVAFGLFHFTKMTELILSVNEQQELERCEMVIKQGLETFIEVGNALMIIRDKRLYRRDYQRFEDYCREKWGMVQQSATRLIRAAAVISNLESEPIGSLPETESQVRPLTKLEPELQAAAWQTTVEQNPDGITAKAVEQSVQDFLPINDQFKYEKQVIQSNAIFKTEAEIQQEVEKRALELIEAKKNVKKAHVSNNSGENEWYTPECYIESARLVMGSIDLDPASSEIANKRVKAKQYFTQNENGLQQGWFGNIWMNPPYAQPLIFQFIEKLADKTYNQAIVLVNNGTETKWGQMILSFSSAVCFHSSRIKFFNPLGELGEAPLQGQMICYIGSNKNTFIQEFNKYGVCLSVE